MLFKFSQCVSLEIGPPQFLLNVTTEVMKLYPWFLKAYALVQRLVQ